MEKVSKRQGGSIDMTNGNPYKLLFMFSIPLLIGNVLQQLYNMVDSIIVGNVVGAKALAAVGTGFPIIFMPSSTSLCGAVFFCQLFLDWLNTLSSDGLLPKNSILNKEGAL